MYIVLLSGGSGKRLWPLSNEVRSKQFLKILKKDDKTYESMVQRVYRQILTIDNQANILIATSKDQVPILKSQLGEKINLSIEPFRRDTFPSILLACLYLKDIKRVDIDETISVCPVDSYVDDDFFHKLNELDEKIKDSSYNIGLIGIKPTYPSEKYGYIINENKDKQFSISNTKTNKFIEKPNITMAKELIEQGALWNGGVFCFKLKYILEVAHKYIDFIDYSDLYNKYENIEKISFDYAVLEKEKSIGVVKYIGDWKDIGTWNTLTDVMVDKSIGDVVIDEKSNNTNVINELNIPIIAMGLNDVIVAASYDGIFVSDKKESSYNKLLVEKIDNRPMFEERLWGTFEVINIFNNSLVKHIYIKKGKNISYQKHSFRKEVWTIIEGTGIFLLNGIKSDVKVGDVLTINIGSKHSIYAISDLHFIEVQLGDKLLEDDIQHYDYIW